MALTAAQRAALPASDFVFPADRRYPIPDREHAAIALGYAKGTADEAAVRAAVRKKFGMA